MLREWAFFLSLSPLKRQFHLFQLLFCVGCERSRPFLRKRDGQCRKDECECSEADTDTLEFNIVVVAP